MSDTATMEVQKTCQIEQVFDLSFIELIRLVPSNPHVRALILRFTGKMPGQDCRTFEQVQEWVETNCKPRLFSHSRSSSRNGISIEVKFSDTEYGRANYTVRRRGYTDYELADEELVELAEKTIDDGDLLDDLIEDIAEKIDQDAWGQCQPNMEDHGDYEYGDHDSGDTENSETEVSTEGLRQAVIRHLREHHPDLLEQLA